jgi:hypothetical protein
MITTFQHHNIVTSFQYGMQRVIWLKSNLSSFVISTRKALLKGEAQDSWPPHSGELFRKKRNIWFQCIKQLNREVNRTDPCSPSVRIPCINRRLSYQGVERENTKIDFVQRLFHTTDISLKILINGTYRLLVVATTLLAVKLGRSIPLACLPCLCALLTLLFSWSPFFVN